MYWSITCIIKALVPTRAAELNFMANFNAISHSKSINPMYGWWGIMGLTSIQASWGYGIPMATRPASHLHWPNVATVPWARPQFSYQGSEAPKNRHKTIQRRHLPSQDLLHEFLVKTPQSAEDMSFLCWFSFQSSGVFSANLPWIVSAIQDLSECSNCNKKVNFMRPCTSIYCLAF